MSVRPSRIARSAVALGLAVAALVVPASAVEAEPAAAHTRLFPSTIPLPDGFAPEGIAIGILPFAYFGSLADGSIYRANLVTGQGRTISEGTPGVQSVGLKIDARGRLFVAGGAAGNARVISAFTGEVLATYQLAATTPTFINDVTLAAGAAWFTDSNNGVVYKVPLGRHGALPDQDQVSTLPLSGDYQHGAGFNGNGISGSPDGRALLLMQSNTATLFRVDPATGEATTVDLGGASLTNGDGVLLRGRTLYVVQNQLNQVAVVRLNRTGSSGTVVDVLTHPDFDIPTTVAAFGNRLYLPNARFGTTPTPTTPYQAVSVRP